MNIFDSTENYFRVQIHSMVTLAIFGQDRGGTWSGGAAALSRQIRRNGARLGIAHLMERGLDRPHAEAIIANGLAESRLDPAAIGDNGTSGGLFQFHNERLTALRSTLGSRAGDFNAQLDYAIDEQRQRDPAWFSPGSAESLTRRWEHGFENPAIETGRLPYLRQIQGLAAPSSVGGVTRQAQPAPPAPAPQVPAGNAAQSSGPINSPFDPRLPKLDLPDVRVPGAGGAGTGPQSSLDTSHKFVLRLENVPPGSRGQMIERSGPAVASVSTSYAMGVV